MLSDWIRRLPPIPIAATLGFYGGIVLGVDSAVSTIRSGDPAFAVFGFWNRVLMVTWAALFHAVVVSAGLALLAGLAIVGYRLLYPPTAGTGETSPLPLGRLRPVVEIVRVRPGHFLVAIALVAFLDSLDLTIVTSASPEPRTPRSANLVLIVVDALRADRLGCYGYPRPTSPHIDALSRRGVTFERAIVQYPATGPSFGSLFTGKYPRKHGLSGMDPRLWLGGDFNRTLAEVLGAAGYHTGAIITGSLTRSSGLARGFFTLFEEMPAYGTYDVRSALETLRSRLPVMRAWVRWRRGRDPHLVVKEAERFVERAPQPFFLFLHLYDTHAPYDPPRQYLDLVRPEAAAYPPLSSDELRTLAGREAPLTAEELHRLEALYDGEVRSADAAVGRLVGNLERIGLLDETVIVLTSDHGEELYDHGKLEHGHIFNTNLRVPLIVVPPSPAAAGVRVDSPVELIDVLPTLLTMVDLAVPDGIDGRPLPLDGAGAAEGEEAYAFAEADCGPRGKACLVSVQDRRWKLTLDREAGALTLFDLERDPLERVDVAAENPEVADRLEKALRKWDSSQPDLAALRQRYQGVEVSEEIRERLRQLGYIE